MEGDTPIAEVYAAAMFMYLCVVHSIAIGDIQKHGKVILDYFLFKDLIVKTMKI